VPIVFDFDEPNNRDTIETVAVLAGLSHFIVADLSRPRSTPLEAHLVIPTIAVPFAPILHVDESPFPMFTALERKYPWVLPIVHYRSPKDVVSRLKKEIVDPAEKKAECLRYLKHPRS
jgi:hypothetical protein